MISRLFGPADWGNAPQDFDSFVFPEGGVYVVTATAEAVTFGPSGSSHIRVGIGTGADSQQFVDATMTESTGAIAYSAPMFVVAAGPGVSGQKLRVLLAVSDNPTTSEMRINVYVARVKEEG